MPRKAELLKSLTRGRIRSSMNKYNLFNLYKKPRTDFRSLTLYQQKWLSKTETRAYHGEHLTESRWQTNFAPNLSSVAQLDSIEKIERGEEIPKTPIQLQTFAVLEKRLDFALFRAMFASSIRQARQFILHGNVKVNGVKITSPGYELKPGDIFSCNPEKVLTALGRGKPDYQTSVKVTAKLIRIWNAYIKECLADPKKGEQYIREYLGRLDQEKRLELLKSYIKTSNTSREEIIADALYTGLVHRHKSPASEVGAESAAEPQQEDEEITAAIYEAAYGNNHKINAKLLLIYKSITEDFYNGKLETLAGKSKEEIQAIVNDLLKKEDNKQLKMIKRLSSEVSRALKNSENDALVSASGDLQIPEALKKHLLEKLSQRGHPILDVKALLSSEEPKKAENEVNVDLPFQKKLFGRTEAKKPYFTPWEPRPFLAPFAILPHHIEISFSTCHAVYLRDPVARPGESEVISPFDISVHERAYMYYVRNGK